MNPWLAYLLGVLSPFVLLGLLGLAIIISTGILKSDEQWPEDE